MQSNDVIEVVTALGGGISEVTLFPDVTAVLACGCIGGAGPPSGIYHPLRATSPCS